MKDVSIGPLTAANGQKPLVVAEAGINHNGQLELALDMIRAASDAGADIVKFQTHIPDAEMVPDKNLDSEAGSHVTRSLYDIMTECMLSLEDHLVLRDRAKELGILFLSTPFSVEAVDLLEKVGVPAYKIGSGEVTNIPFLKYVASRKKPIILSTGTANWEEIGKAVDAVKRDVPGLVVLQCTSNYPTLYENVNLGVMRRIEETYGVLSGLSDHCTGNYACFGAVALGACIVEKHFTLSRDLPGIDQASSIEPNELRDLVEGVRAVYQALGQEKYLNEEAEKVRYGFSESIVTINPVKAGEVLVERVNVWVKRPGSGIPSYELPEVVGKKASKDLPDNYLVQREDIGE